MKELSPGSLSKPRVVVGSKLKDESLAGVFGRTYRQTPISLFRFSALTFNAHKIHFHPGWSSEVEGHPTTVVHGPLNLVNLLDLWRDYTRSGNKPPKSI